MEIDPATLAPFDLYKLMIACVVPRPIGWISTISEDGRPNLAPFSFFGGVSASPIVVMLSVARRRGKTKDTARNLLATKEAVVHIPHGELAQHMVLTSSEEEPDVNEFELASLTQIPSTRVRPPRVGESAIAMEAKLERHLEIGTSPVDFFLLEVVYLHIADRYLENGLPDPNRLAALGRLGGALYCDTSRTFQIDRPSGMRKSGGGG